ncbi:hypothetical protein D9M72_313600 [compost metagenome]
MLPLIQHVQAVRVRSNGMRNYDPVLSQTQNHFDVMNILVGYNERIVLSLLGRRSS